MVRTSAETQRHPALPRALGIVCSPWATRGRCRPLADCVDVAEGGGASAASCARGHLPRGGGRGGRAWAAARSGVHGYRQGAHAHGRLQNAERTGSSRKGCRYTRMYAYTSTRTRVYVFGSPSRIRLVYAYAYTFPCARVNAVSGPFCREYRLLAATTRLQCLQSAGRVYVRCTASTDYTWVNGYVHSVYKPCRTCTRIRRASVYIWQQGASCRGRAVRWGSSSSTCPGSVSASINEVWRLLMSWSLLRREGSGLAG